MIIVSYAEWYRNLPSCQRTASNHSYKVCLMFSARFNKIDSNLQDYKQRNDLRYLIVATANNQTYYLHQPQQRGDGLNQWLTKHKITGKAQHHLPSPCHWSTAFQHIRGIRTVLRLPSGLQRAAPTKTPGSAIAPKRSCHSAVFLRSEFLMTLEMIVAEKTPLGKVTCRNGD